jgi:sugar lactone lactonase YvrE
MNSVSLVGLLLLLVPGPALAQTSVATDPVLESRTHYAEALQAYKARDYPQFLEHARLAQRLRPTHGAATYALAAAYALTGDTAAALASLRRFAELGYTAEPAADSDYATLRGSLALEEVERRLVRNRAPLVRSKAAFTLPEPDLLAEGVAYDRREGTFFVSAVHARKIIAMTRDGRFSDFAVLDAPGLWAPLGMRVDPVRRLLWAATAAVPQMAGYARADSGRSALLRFDLETGKLTGRFAVPDDGRPHALGDVTVTRAGDVYASDSRSPILFRVPANADSLERFLESPLLLSAQGLALDGEERTLYIADYSRGVIRVDLASRVAAVLPAADTVLALGIDGLYYHAGALIGIQNGVEPHRVVRLELSPDRRQIVRSMAIERAHPQYAEPTLGVLEGRDLYYVANSQWERFGNGGRIAEPDSLRRPVVLRLRL